MEQKVTVKLSAKFREKTKVSKKIKTFFIEFLEREMSERENKYTVLAIYSDVFKIFSSRASFSQNTPKQGHTCNTLSGGLMLFQMLTTTTLGKVVVFR